MTRHLLLFPAACMNHISPAVQQCGRTFSPPAEEGREEELDAEGRPGQAAVAAAGGGGGGWGGGGLR